MKSTRINQQLLSFFLITGRYSPWDKIVIPRNSWISWFYLSNKVKTFINIQIFKYFFLFWQWLFTFFAQLFRFKILSVKIDEQRLNFKKKSQNSEDKNISELFNSITCNSPMEVMWLTESKAWIAWLESCIDPTIKDMSYIYIKVGNQTLGNIR